MLLLLPLVLASLVLASAVDVESGSSVVELVVCVLDPELDIAVPCVLASPLLSLDPPLGDSDGQPDIATTTNRSEASRMVMTLRS